MIEPWNPFTWTAAAWAAAAAWGTFAIAGVAALFARHQVAEARKTREEQAQPFVVVDFEPSEVWGGLMNLVISNTGRTLAKDVRIKFDPALESAFFRKEDTKSYDISQSAILREGIPTLPPGKSFTILFDRMPDRHSSDLPMVYRATVHFSSTRRREEPLVYTLDLGIYFGTLEVDVYGVHHVAKALREIERTLKKWRR